MTSLCFGSSGAGYDEAFDLLKVVDVVAGHGFYDGPEGHGASLGVGGGAVARVDLPAAILPAVAEASEA